MSRADHQFQFPAVKIANACQEEAEYHEGRVEHWRGRRDPALERVKQTASVTVVESEMTGGDKSVSLSIDYGDPAAWQEYQLAHRKVQEHRAAAARLRADERLYRTQGERVYELSGEDVYHFRLGGQARPE